MLHARQRLTRSSARFGFTLPEMLIVIVIISVLALVAIPRFATGNAKRHMESARMRVAAALATARAAAIQKGEPVRFQIKSNRVTVFTIATADTLMIKVPLDTLYKVDASKVNGVPTSPLQIDFTARGFANAGSRKVITLSRTGVPDDSVVVTPTGMVQR